MNVNPLSLVLILLTAFLAVYLQSTVDFFRNLTGAQLNLLPPLIVYVALTHGVSFVAVLAVCGGLWMDSLSANPLAVSVLPLFFVGLVIYRYQTLLLRDHVYAQFVLGLSASVIAPAGTLLILFSMDANPLFGWGSVWQFFVVAITGGLLTPLCFRFFDRIGGALSYPQLKEPTFRSDREIKRGRT